MTGYNLFLKDEFSKRNCDQLEGDWQAKRTSIVKDATHQWNQQTYEMRRLRSQYSAKAKAMNNSAKLKHALSMRLGTDTW